MPPLPAAEATGGGTTRLPHPFLLSPHPLGPSTASASLSAVNPVAVSGGCGGGGAYRGGVVAREAEEKWGGRRSCHGGRWPTVAVSTAGQRQSRSGGALRDRSVWQVNWGGFWKGGGHGCPSSVGWGRTVYLCCDGGMRAELWPHPCPVKTLAIPPAHVALPPPPPPDRFFISLPPLHPHRHPHHHRLYRAALPRRRSRH